MSEYEEFQTPAWTIGKTLPPLNPASTTGVDLISQERSRQVSEEGWSPEHDDSHRTEELAQAAACYATPAHHRRRLMSKVPILWPWSKGWWKPMAGEWTAKKRIMELVKAGALVAAEIDRLLRAQSAALTFPTSAKPPASELPATADSPSGPMDNDSKVEKDSLYEERKVIAELLGWKVYSDNPNGSPYTGPCGTAPGSCHSLEDLEHLPTLGELVDVLRARLQKQEEDTKRLDWIEKNPHSLGHCTWLNASVGRCWDFQNHGDKTIGECAVTIREAIDSALSQTPVLVHSKTEEKKHEN